MITSKFTLKSFPCCNALLAIFRAAAACLMETFFEILSNEKTDKKLFVTGTSTKLCAKISKLIPRFAKV